ncbi:MAG: gliding motility-associated C-terminal domain-containing protein [Bacteroidales bacterium]|nr:gliding motility-associated C-terminal domain-containing protein [Bacteroidales bacterium]
MNKNIDQIYKERFENFEAPVPEGLWDKIQQNPTWKRRLHRRAVGNMTVYACLALIAIGTCIALLYHRPASDTLVYEPAIPEELTTNPVSTNHQASEVAEPYVSASENTSTPLPIEQEQETALYDIPTAESVPTPTDPILDNQTDIIETQPYNILPKSEVNRNDSPVIPNITLSQDPKTVNKTEEPSIEKNSTPSASNHTAPVQSLFSIPNAFTPNGDDINDVFKPITSAEITNYQMDIFLLNGQIIFSSRNIDLGWNGEYQGGAMNAGHYIYVIRYKDSTGQEHIDKGQLLLIR